MPSELKWPTESKPRVIAAFGAKVLVLDRGEVLTAPVRKSAGKPVCGDRVRLEVLAGESVVTAISPRHNSFARADRRGRRQVIAANVDRVVAVIAPHPAPTRDIVHRYLVAAELNECDATVCVNKSDLDGADALSAQYDFVKKLGYGLIETSASTGQGIEDMASHLAGEISILVGQSGVGKTSLTSQLLGGLDLKTDRLSLATGKGRHTTSRSSLYPLPGGGLLMDSPGVWEYGLWQMSPREMAHGFTEFSRAGPCRFSDCTHVHEPECGVEDAVEEGKIDPRRLAAYRRILASIERFG